MSKNNNIMIIKGQPAIITFEAEPGVFAVSFLMLMATAILLLIASAVCVMRESYRLLNSFRIAKRKVFNRSLKRNQSV